MPVGILISVRLMLLCRKYCHSVQIQGLLVSYPYRQQADEINKALGKDIASTVHKYQGRECDTIIMSMVDNKPTEFSDDSNLLNVAISRAKTHLYVVTNSNKMPKESNLAQLRTMFATTTSRFDKVRCPQFSTYSINNTPHNGWIL